LKKRVANKRVQEAQKRVREAQGKGLGFKKEPEEKKNSEKKSHPTQKFPRSHINPS